VPTLRARRSLSEWLRYIQSVHHRSIDMTLERPRTVLAKMGLSTSQFVVISVSGTNGKGSSVAMLEEIYIGARYKVGAYTSPHLVLYNERVSINGEPVSDAELCDAFELVEGLRGEVPLTYFEFGTLAAVEIFCNRKVDVALLEVGMGGRLDAVNLFDANVALITAIGIDHVAWLGKDRESIGYEKAGLFRAAAPGICADPDPPQSVRRAAAKVGAKFYQAQIDFHCQMASHNWSWRGPNGPLENLPLPLDGGASQVQNASGALMVLECLSSDLPLSPWHIRQGLTHAKCPGRLQVISGEPLHILDVAHNVEAVHLLCEFMKRHVVPGLTFAVVGMLQDKPIESMVAMLVTTVDAWHVGSLNVPRGAQSSVIARAIRGASPAAHIAEHLSVQCAYRAACAAATSGDRIVVFGSFYTVGAIMPCLQQTL